jgi:phosphoglycerol transferase
MSDADGCCLPLLYSRHARTFGLSDGVIATAVAKGARSISAWALRSWRYAATAAIAIVLWSAYYERWPGTPSFQLPVSYIIGDTLLLFGIAKGFSALPPPWDLVVERLNAPFGADWNDYPHTEKLIFYPWGLLLRWLPVGSAANLVMLFTHVSAAMSFAWTASRLGRSPPIAHAGALLFAFSPFVLARGLAHVNVSIIWHLPLLLFLTVRLASIEQVPARRVQIGAYLLLIATSFLNPYYPPIVFQLLALALLRAWTLQRYAVARFAATLLAVGVGTFLLGQVNVYLRSWSAGPNHAFSGRSLEAIRLWSLRLPDLFMPLRHPVLGWQEFARTHYFEAGNPVSENSMAFLGIVGCALLIALMLVSLVKGLGQRWMELGWEVWVIAYLLLFSLSGGLDYLLGSLGVTWLRAVNRYSVLILCATLLWGCKILDNVRRPLTRHLIGATTLGVALIELFGMRAPSIPEHTAWISETMASDRRFGRDLERALKRRAAVFMLPVMEFPESSPIVDMADYEPMRLFLWTRSLRFSYGNHKGRPRERWQRQAAGLAPSDMVTYLGQHGFDALLINRRGFADRAQGLESRLSHLRKHESPLGDLVAYELKRTGSALPVPAPE